MTIGILPKPKARLLDQEPQDHAIATSSLPPSTPVTTTTRKNPENKLDENIPSPPSTTGTVKALSISLNEKLSLTPRPLRTKQMNQSQSSRLESTAPKTPSALSKSVTVSRSPEDTNEETNQDQERSFVLQFDAPQFHDFAAKGEAVDDDEADTWFDAKNDDEASSVHAYRPRLSFLNEQPVSSRTRSSLSKTHPKKTGISGAASTSKGSVSARLLAPTQSRAAKMATSMTANALKKRHPKSPGSVSKKSQGRATSRGLTVPKPFNLRTSRKAEMASAAENPLSPFVPLAAKVAKFQNQTPLRFKRTVPKPEKVKVNHLKLTQPQSPFLSTKLRSKPSNLLPKEEIEVKELESIPKFKAKPINKKILTSDKPLGVPEPPKFELTVPMSPAITKPRLAPPKAPSPPRVIKANPVPEFVYAEPKLKAPAEKVKPLTLPSDFKLPGEEISQKKKQQFLEALKKEEEEAEAARHFKAHPLPPEEPDHLPSVEKAPLTNPEPFQLHTESRGALHQMHFSEKLSQEERQIQEKREFKAHEILPAVHDPFVPKRSDRPLTETAPIVLHTDLRVEERKEFDEERRLREEQEAEQRRIMEERQKEQEQKEIKELRKKATHKAQPIRKYAPTVIEQSRKKLTEPRSPIIGEKRRKAMQSSQEAVVPSKLRK